MRKKTKELRDLPNIGPATEKDLRLLGIHEPDDLAGRDPVAMYDELCKIMGYRQDPCVLDTFMAVVDYVKTGESKPWWVFTAERKRMMSREEGSR